MTEIWKPIPNFEGIYSASNMGRIRSDTRFDRIGRRCRERIMKTGKTKDGYLQIDLLKEGRRTKHLVHRLVMLAFKGECPAGYEVNHINEDKTDNRLENLEYTTHLQNVRHGTGIARMAQANKRPIIAIKPDGSVERYESAKDAGIILSVNSDVISHALNEKHRKTAYGREWQFV